MEPQAYKRKKRVKLIFNPKSGANNESPIQLMDVIKEMQVWNFMPEPYIMEPDCNLDQIVQDTIMQGLRMIIVCGGDGTVSSVCKAMIGTKVTLGIIPTGTQNNIARSLGIPNNIPDAILLLRAGRRLQIDAGMVTFKEETTPFIEICSVGLFANLYESGDGIQHGDFTRIGDFLATLTTAPPSEIQLSLDNKQDIRGLGHVVLVSNMPYCGRHFSVASPDCFSDGFLDVLFFADVSKLELIGHILKGTEPNTSDDPRIHHFRVRKVSIDTFPHMPIMADGKVLGEGPLQIEIKRHALTVIVNSENSNKKNNCGKSS